MTLCILIYYATFFKFPCIDVTQIFLNPLMLGNKVFLMQLAKMYESYEKCFFLLLSLSISWKASWEGSVVPRGPAVRSRGTPLSCTWLSEPHSSRATSPESFPSQTAHHPPFPCPMWFGSVPLFISWSFLPNQEGMRMTWENHTDPACVPHQKEPHKHKIWPRMLMQFVFF